MYVPKDSYGREFTLDSALSHVGSGWSELVTECYQICAENEIDIAQIKEKFGVLRFYISHGTDEIYSKIDYICSKSTKICAYCGKDAKQQNINGWLKTICADCYEKETKNY